MAKKPKTSLDRRVALGAILARRGESLLVTGLGSTCYDAGTMDHPNTFYLWGGMGAAAMVGLGLALAQPKRQVIVATGDGEMLMALGALATIGAQRPRNLAIGIAKASGFARSGTVYNLKQLNAWVPSLYKAQGPLFLAAKVTSQRYPMSIRYRDGTAIKNRFRENLLGFDKAYY